MTQTSLIITKAPRLHQCTYAARYHCMLYVASISGDCGTQEVGGVSEMPCLCQVCDGSARTVQFITLSVAAVYVCFSVCLFIRPSGVVFVSAAPCC